MGIFRELCRAKLSNSGIREILHCAKLTEQSKASRVFLSAIFSFFSVIVHTAFVGRKPYIPSMYYLHNQSQEMATHMFCQKLSNIYFFLFFFFSFLLKLFLQNHLILLNFFIKIQMQSRRLFFLWQQTHFEFYIGMLIFMSYFYFYDNFVWSNDSQLYTNRKIKVIILSNFGFPRAIPAAMWPHLTLTSLCTKKKKHIKVVFSWYL